MNKSKNFNNIFGTFIKAQEPDKEKQEHQRPEIQQSLSKPSGTNNQQQGLNNQQHGLKNQQSIPNIQQGPKNQQQLGPNIHQQGPKIQQPGPGGPPPAFTPKGGSQTNEELSSQNDGPPEKRARKRPNRSRERFSMNDRFRDDNFYGGRDDYPPPGGGYGIPPIPPPVIEPPQPDRNDCEIIVVSKPLT